ncbi:MAG: DUF2723 domain-containing protein [Bacteroidales bacterium]|nr:DUF2723 domain-containing protein [Bacteroidales bacterium]
MQKKQKKHIPHHIQPKQQTIKEKIIYPKNKNVLFYSTLGLSFLVSFVFYILTLAPTISFEDSGELITAAYFLGVPHEPGYPLFTIFGKLFTLLVPFGSIAYKVNMMSAFFSALASAFITWSMIIIIEDVFIESKFWKDNNEKFLNILKYLVALSSGWFFAFCNETWEQAVMTEVYGLNSCFVALFILLALFWRRQETIEKRKKYLFIISFVMALAFTCHTTSLMLIPIFGVFVLAVDYKILLNFKTILKSALFFLLGLFPFLYLPFASMHNPPMDWGNPENLTNFFRVVNRHQYTSDDPHTAERFISQFKYYLNHLLPEQWYPVFIIFAVIGVFMIYKKNKKLFYFVLTFLIFSIPVMTYETNFDVATNKDVAIENGALVSVFYIPSYMILSLLTGAGFLYILSLIKIKIHYLVALLFVAFSISGVYKNYKNNDMSNYYYPQKFVDNIFKIATKNSIVIGDWDPYCFPFFYYQYVEKKRQDVLSLDLKLLKRSWYIQYLKNYYPEIIKSSQTEVDKFLESVAPFEEHISYDGAYIQLCYENMIRSMIDKNLSKGRDVYVTYIDIESNEVLKNYPRESVFAAYKIPREGALTKVNYSDFDLKDFINADNPSDRLLVKFREYYGGLVLQRATLFQKLENKSEAIKFYKLSLPFFSDNKEAQSIIYNRIEELK